MEFFGIVFIIIGSVVIVRAYPWAKELSERHDDNPLKFEDYELYKAIRNLPFPRRYYFSILSIGVVIVFSGICFIVFKTLAVFAILLLSVLGILNVCFTKTMAKFNLRYRNIFHIRGSIEPTSYFMFITFVGGIIMLILATSILVHLLLNF